MRSICLSFWSVGMSNLAVGIIRKRVLSTEEARSLIHQARAADKLSCVSGDDVGAPCGSPEREQLEELCAALRQHADIDLEDFFGADCSNPLCLALISEEQSLLLVDCHYGLDGAVLPETIAFYLFETDNGDRPAYEADGGPLTDRDIKELRKIAEAALPKGDVISKQTLL